MSVGVLLVDDHKILRKGLRSLLEKEPGIEVLGEADNGRTAVRLAKKLQPKVVLMDVVMPGLNGIDATRQILAEAPGIKVLALSMHSDSRFVRGMLQAGASGYLLKDCAVEELTRAIKTVAQGRTHLSPGVSGEVIRSYTRQLSENATEAAALTPREREVLQILAEGKSTKEIADLLHISVKTVETHRRRIMEKLDLHSVAELTKYALREGLTTLDG